jgi:SAM-dependent methyltransferase
VGRHGPDLNWGSRGDVTAGSPGRDVEAVRRSYDAIASDYVTRIYSELEGKPFDRHLLDELAEATHDRGLICDLGCGPGHVARYLHDRGSEVCGVDLSPRMVEEARRLNPDINFTVGDMRSLDIAEGAFAGVVAFYSLIHHGREELVETLAEIRRILRRRGVLLAAFHRGSETVHVDDWWGHDVSLDVVYVERSTIEAATEATGLALEQILERAPYPGVEVETNRLYLLAHKP